MMKSRIRDTTKSWGKKFKQRDIKLNFEIKKAKFRDKSQISHKKVKIMRLRNCNFRQIFKMLSQDFDIKLLD